MAELSIGIFSHHFTVTRLTPRGRAAVESFARRFVQYGFNRARGGRYQRTALKVFAGATNDRYEFRFHINQYKDFKQHLTNNYITEEMSEVIHYPTPIPRMVELKVKPKWQPRDQQPLVIDYMVQPGFQKLVELQTGKGKSYCAMAAASIIGARMVIIVKAQFLEKWVDDVHKTYELELEDVLLVRGSSQLQALLAIAKSGALESKIIIMSNKTIQNWLKLYERHRHETSLLGYEAFPHELFEVLEAGLRLIDEVHMDFHLNFKIDLYTNVEKSISLSATLIADDDFLSNMYRMTYPMETRFKGLPYDKYVHCLAVLYSLKDQFKIKGKDPATGKYSHNYYEQQILKYPLIASNYLELIDKTIKASYLLPEDYKPGDRLLILCASIDFCSVLTDFLKKRYPHLDVRRYVEDDPYENLLEPDIRVSTMLSAGTGHDIAELTTVLMPLAMRTSGGNIQGLGRLRKLPGRKLKFWYFCCESIDKQMEYHEQKVEILKTRALTLNTWNTGVQI